MVAKDFASMEVVDGFPYVLRGGVTLPPDSVQKVAVFVRVVAVGVVRLVGDDIVHGEGLGSAGIRSA